MSVFRRPASPYWHFDFVIDNRRFSGSTKIRTDRPKSEAQAVETEERSKAQRLVDHIRATDRQPLTFAAAADRWWQEVGRETGETGNERILQWLKQQIGDVLLHDLSNREINAVVQARRTHVVRAGTDAQRKPEWRPIRPKTVNETIGLIRRIVRRAYQRWDVLILREPNWRDHFLKVSRGPIRELSAEEEKKLSAVEGDFAALRRFAQITGLRLAEALLTWPQVDFDNALVRVIAKGDKPRQVPLNREAYAILWGERGRHPTAVFTFVARKTRVEPRTRKKYVKGTRYPITYWGVQSHVRRVWRDKAGVEAHFHNLRHTAGMRTLRATGNLKVTQRLLGHSDVSTTARFYADALIDDVRAAMDAVAAARPKEPLALPAPEAEPGKKQG